MEQSNTLISKRSSWTGAPFPHEMRAMSILDKNEGQVDTSLVDLVGRIPYYSWGGGINNTLSRIKEGISGANRATIHAICSSLLEQPEQYWTDNKERNFEGLEKSIEERMKYLGFTPLTKQSITYNGNFGKSILSLPIYF